MADDTNEERRMAAWARLLLPAMFFVSGFCGLLYQTIWLRLAFARFGVITPIVSALVSVFMLGLGLGSWLGGKYVRAVSHRFRLHAIYLYGLIEITIGLGAFSVPALFAKTSGLLLGLGETNSWGYLAGSTAVIFVSILPFSCAMGATYPAALQLLEEVHAEGRHRFGQLYAFNTAGAVLGVLATVYLLIELLGLHGVLRFGFFGNVGIAALAAFWGSRLPRPEPRTEVAKAEASSPRLGGLGESLARSDLAILFTTGFCSMGMEVGWVRSFTPVLEHSVYAFAFLLAAYLTGHALGAAGYAVSAARGATPAKGLLLGAMLVTAGIPIAFADWEWAPGEDGRIEVGAERIVIALGIGAFAAVLGWLTPMLVDKLSAGRPRQAGLAYAANIAGCMLGPLVMGYLVLPFVGPRIGLALLCLPLIGLLALDREHPLWKGVAILGGGGILTAALFGRSFEEGRFLIPGEREMVYRDYTATTIARERNGMRELLVNGFPMTTQSPVTQMMAHLPFALHVSPPQKVLVICLGMGTTFQSALTWDADVTVVELVPGVVRAFETATGENHPLGGHGHIVIDDGRRFLARTNEKFDVIIVDPPPPVEQPASSLLYSVEFYELMKAHLNPDGIVQEWWGFPAADPILVQAMARSIRDSFPYVRVFRSVDDPPNRMQGYHFIGSLAPLPPMTAEQFLARLPARALRDLADWTMTDQPGREIEARIRQQLEREFRWKYQGEARLTDDRPLNEYLYLRDHAWTARVYMPH